MGILVMLGSLLLKAVLPGLATAASGYVVGILRKQLKRAHVQLTDEQAASVAAAVERAVMAVEEQAHRRPSMTGTEKRQVAIDLVLDERPGIDRAVIGAVIDATLQKIRRR